MFCYHFLYYFLLVFCYGFLANLTHGENCQLHQSGLISEIPQVVTMPECDTLSLSKPHLPGRTICYVNDISRNLCG